jgi:hypothetical protein
VNARTTTRTSSSMRWILAGVGGKLKPGRVLAMVTLSLGGRSGNSAGTYAVFSSHSQGGKARELDDPERPAR